MSIPFEKLTSFIEKVDGDAYQYLLKIRQTIGGYGSKHSKIFETIDREGFDLKPYIQDYLQSLDESIINQHLEWCKTAIKNVRKFPGRFSLNLCQRLLHVCNDILYIFNPHRQTDQIRCHAGGKLFLGRQLLVRSGSRVNHQRFCVTDIGE